MMQVTIEGLLVECELTEGELQSRPQRVLLDVPKFEDQLDGSYTRLQNLSEQYSTRKLPIFILPRNSGIEGLRVELKITKIDGKLGPIMLQLPRKEWKGKKYRVQFKISPYQFISRLEYNKGEMVKGCTFHLLKIDLVE
jgi:hypothetical protein